MKANFLSMITHELRSPLNAIHGYLDLTLTGIAGDLNEQQREFVQRARASSEHLYALVEDLLLVSRADSGQVRLNREITNLQEYPGRDGFVPTARGGARYDLGNGEYLRVAGYIGFRAPTLNELYRPFRVGNDITQANANLRPEDLYGAEVGWGGVWESLHWDTTAFWNQLHNAIANVTIGQVFCGPVPCGVLPQN